VAAARLLAIGDITWDVLFRPAGELVWGADVYGAVDLLPGGSAANVAVWATRLGAAVTLVGKIGDDRLGHLMRAHLADEGLAGGVTTVSGGLTTRIGVVIRPDAERAFVTDHTRLLRLAAADLPASLLDGVDVVFLNGYAVFTAGSADFATGLLTEARRRDVAVAFDPSSCSLLTHYGPSRLLAEIGPLDILLANEDEGRALAPGRPFSALLDHAALAVVKRGSEGAMAMAGPRVVHGAAERVAVVDSTGAGDAFDAAFLVEYWTRGDLAGALAEGNRLGGRVTSRLGAQGAR
jgi:sugar/nucleoside kinase (ribokinase family)